MGKRTLFDADGKSTQGGHELKRQRIEGSHEVTTARDLQKALLFDQRAHGDFRSGQLTSRRHVIRMLTVQA